MSERGEQLAVRVEEKMSEVIRALEGLTEADLRVPSADPKAPTVGGLLAHLDEGTDQVLAWAGGAQGDDAGRTGPGRGPGHAHGHGHGHGGRDGGAAGGPDLAGTITLLRQGRAALAGIVRGLTDEQLGSFPPPARDLTDGSRTLSQVIDFIIDDLTNHLGYLRAALAGDSRLRQEAK